jgi:hypothetical protein
MIDVAIFISPPSHRRDRRTFVALDARARARRRPSGRRLRTAAQPPELTGRAQNAGIFGGDIGLAFPLTFLNKCDELERPMVAGFHQRAFGADLPESAARVEVAQGPQFRSSRRASGPRSSGADVGRRPKRVARLAGGFDSLATFGMSASGSVVEGRKSSAQLQAALPLGDPPRPWNTGRMSD